MANTPNAFSADAKLFSPNGFKMRRANATVTGFRPTVDDHIAARLQELDNLLGRKVIPKAAGSAKTLVTATLTPHRAVAAAAPQPAPAVVVGAPAAAPPRNQNSIGEWAHASLADRFHSAAEDPNDRTLTDYIDGDATLANLSYGFDDALDDSWNELDFNIKSVLGYPNIRRLLVVSGFLGLNITQPTSLMNFVLTHKAGVQSFVRYGVISAARDYIEETQLRVKDIDNDGSDVVLDLIGAALSFSSETFPRAALEVVTDYTHDAKYEQLVAAAKIDFDTLPSYVKPRLIEYIKTSPVTITKDNAPFWIPTYITKAAAGGAVVSGPSSDEPFGVEFFVEDSASLQVSTAAVKCASQLYYVMVLGDELGVFDAVRYFTHRYLFRDGFAVEDPQLRRDLENYVFSEQFPSHDNLTGQERMVRSTRPGERRSFYRQVFDEGSEPVPGDGIPNADFARLWKILMLESARYLEKAQSSPHPDNYVSRQNVMQAVEDLQYNLSTGCVGMATVMTPLMYSELDFVVKRILGHAEVRKHLVPSGGSWWKVVEKLQAGQGRRGRASVVHNKARIGYSLIRAIAEYTPSRFEEDEPFAEFISNVDAFITTQSILQEESGGATTEADGGEASGDVVDGHDDGYGGSNGYGSGSTPGMPDLSKLPGMPAIPGVSAPWPGGGGAGTGAPVATSAPNGNGSAAASDWDF
ncbi:hypothetical protein [Mycobacterium sp. URHB0044]|jgi:hypothetical protein|uniref:hypothetical protein n=1 Tax=Mycobacterium sp. URHB0044 TaxID=1380386 RepID=UPI000490A0AF|nr:hypothetical protein [Mycobacterium sp. URHB0044]